MERMVPEWGSMVRVWFDRKVSLRGSKIVEVWRIMCLGVDAEEEEREEVGVTLLAISQV